jgi:hypothetical protein
MPHATVDKLVEKTARLRKKLAEKGNSLDGTSVRELKKKIRRAQRARRRQQAKTAAMAGKTEPKAG